MGFSLYGVVHLLLLFSISAIVLAFALLFRRVSPRRQKTLTRALAWGMLFMECLKDIALVVTGQFRPNYLPFDLCGLSIFLEFFAVYFPNKWLLECLYSLSLPGACLALFFPDWSALPVWNFFCIYSFLLHGCSILQIVLIFQSTKFRPCLKRLPFCFVCIALACLPMIWLNHILDTNFFFLSFASPGSPLEWFGTHFGNYRIGLPVCMAAIWLILYGVPGLAGMLRRKGRRGGKSG